VLVYAVVDDALSPDFPLGVELGCSSGREDAERRAAAKWLTDILFDPHSSGLLLRPPPATPRWCAGRRTSIRHRLDSCAADPFAGLVAATALATGRAAELHVRNPA
jgi:hypothetical protein